MNTKRDWLNKEKGLVSIILHCEKVMNHPNTDGWEIKEYKEILVDYNTELKETREHMEFLKECGLWVTMDVEVNENSIMAFGMSI